MISEHESVLVRRLRDLLAKRNMTPHAVSVKADLAVGAVRDILAGKSDQPRKATLKKIAAVLGTDVNYLLGHPHKNSGGEPQPFEPIAVPVLAVIAELGASRMLKLDPLAEFLTGVPRSRRFPNADHFAVPMQTPHGASPRYALCVNHTHTGLAVSTGALYVVCRNTGKAGKGSNYETAIRRARVFHDRIELEAFEAAVPDVQRTTTELNGDRAKPIFILGLVYGEYREHEKFDDAPPAAPR